MCAIYLRCSRGNVSWSREQPANRLPATDTGSNSANRNVFNAEWQAGSDSHFARFDSWPHHGVTGLYNV
jgi:hypothetical protein